jgi:hypothetical protein
MELALTKIIQHNMVILDVSQFQEKSGLNTAAPFPKRHGYYCSPSYTTVLAIQQLIKPNISLSQTPQVFQPIFLMSEQILNRNS